MEKKPNKTSKKNLCEMRLLQFECSVCGFKVYINLEDDYELPKPIKCMNCGKKKSIKSRVFDITINDFRQYIKKLRKCPTCGRGD